MAADRIQFGNFEIDTANFELRRGSTRIKLERIPMELLILLAENKGRLIQRAEMVEAIWGKGCFLESDSAINTAIRKLRRVLGDQPRSPMFIETIPRKGYRFLTASSHHRTPDDAKALYSRALHYWNRKTPESYLEAIRLYQKSLDIDPEYALPYIGLAKTWILFGIHGLQPSHDVYPRAKVAALRALELDGSIAEGYAALADIAKGYDWDWGGAEAHYLHALALGPKCGIAHQWYANLLSILGRHDEALSHAKEARSLDPLSVGPAGFVGFTYLRARRFREAVREAETALSLEPNSSIANWFLGLALAAVSRLLDARKAFSTAVKQSHGAPIYLSALGYVHAASGDPARAGEILAELHRESQQRYVSPFDLGIVYMALGELDSAFQHLEMAEQQRVMRLTELAMPIFDPLRASARYHAILARMALNSG